MRLGVAMSETKEKKTESKEIYKLLNKRPEARDALRDFERALEIIDRYKVEKKHPEQPKPESAHSACERRLV